MKRVGILGGGQLGLLLAHAVRNLGGRPRFYDPDPEAPAARQFADTVTAAWTDEAALARFAGDCDVLTYEFENIVTSGLRALASLPPVLPSLDALETAQHRLREKQFLERTGLPRVEFRAARTIEELREALSAFGYPAIVKTAGGGYDGKGQRFVRDERELQAIAPSASGWVIEEPIALACEVSCIVARAPGGEERVFPVLENLHEHHILDRTLVPARISPALAAQAREAALEAARALDVRGLLTVEFFVGRSARAPERELFVNELAPRPHNSGHVTLRACTFSQFDALARILLDVPVGEPRLAGPGAYCMGNLLGDVWLAQGREQLELAAWADHPRVLDVTLYGKRGARERRKMGHFIVRADSADEALDEALAFRRALAKK
ncbi:MAG TPA: ATP-grasp domain-containing protein [Polyangia bacterium]|nr:ATP-grasp domain-containing protein [Polyangia bacterium]